MFASQNDTIHQDVGIARAGARHTSPVTLKQKHHDVRVGVDTDSFIELQH